MNKLVRSISKRLNKIAEANKIPIDAPLGDILVNIGNANYGEAYSVIAHGGGGTQHNYQMANLYTNSKEAVNDSILDGKKLIELDLAVTSDGHIVAIHSWSEVKAKIKFNGVERQVLHDESPLSYAEVKNIDFGNGIKPLCMDDINEVFSTNEDLILVTDKIKDISLLVSTFDYIERLIVEVFDFNSYELAFSLGVKNVVYNIDIRKKDVTKWVIKNKIKAVTFSAREVNLHPRGYENALILMKNGVVSLAYTSNDDTFIRSNIGITISACYTDYWSLKEMRCIPMGGSITY